MYLSPKSFTRVTLLAVLLSMPVASALAQGSPIPGAAPLPGQFQTADPGQASFSAPSDTVTRGQSPQGRSRYRQLPLTAADAKQKIDELKALLAGSPQNAQDGILEMVEWLQDAADAHYRMATAFGKNDATKREAASERQLTAKFGELKREALLLKADLLIKQRRAPEALAPLVDIVIADPRGATGQAAYHRLQELGFSQSLPSDVATNSFSSSPAPGVRAASTVVRAPAR